MSQAQRLLKNGNQCMAGSSLNSFVALVELDFRKFKIPVAVLVPNEGVDCVGSVIETVVFKGLTDFLNSTFELGPNPLERSIPSEHSDQDRSLCLQCSSERSVWRSRACCRNCGNRRRV